MSSHTKPEAAEQEFNEGSATVASSETGTDAAPRLGVRRMPVRPRGHAAFERILDTTAALLEEVGIENVTTNLEVDANGEWWNRHFPYPQVKSTSLSWNGRHRERITVDLNPPIPDVEEWLEDPDDG